jgi:hypothetical protein
VNCRIKAAIFLLLASCIPGWAQSEQLNPVGRHRDGLYLTTASVFSGYSSLTLPNGSGFLSTAVPLRADVNFGGEATLTWNYTGQKTNASLTYSPSYMGLIRHSEWSSLNHILSFAVNRKLGRKWNIELGLSGSAVSLSQSLFTPTVFSSVTAVGATFDDLAGAILSGELTNNQLASLLTGAPVVESPARTLIYGNRMLSTGASVSVSYAPSTRLSVHFSAVASRAQYLNDGQDPEAAQYKALVPRTIGGNAGVGVSYKVTPRTDFGFDASVSRTLSTLQDAYTGTGRITLGRKVSRRWFLQGYGGAGKIIPLRETVQLPQGPQYIAGGSIGFRTRAHTFLAAADRSVSDSYAIGSARALSSTGSWTWRRRGSGWRLSTSGGWQKLVGGVDLEGWTVTGAVTRALSRETALQVSYAYMSGSSASSGVQFQQQDIAIHSMRLALMWTPAEAH